MVLLIERERERRNKKPQQQWQNKREFVVVCFHYHQAQNASIFLPHCERKRKKPDGQMDDYHDSAKNKKVGGNAKKVKREIDILLLNRSKKYY